MNNNPTMVLKFDEMRFKYQIGHYNPIGTFEVYREFDDPKTAEHLYRYITGGK